MNKSGYLYFVIPALSVLAIVLVYPLAYSLWISLFSYYLPSPPPVFVGLKNYISTIRGSDLLHALAITFPFTGGVVCMQFVLGLVIALLLNRIEVGRRVLTTIVFLPHMVTPVVAGLILKWMFIPEWGMVNYFLGLLHIQGLPWLSHPFYAFVAIMLADSWRNTPLVVIVLLAGLRSLPQEPIEAARIDGASGFRMLWHIILPLLKPIILFIAIIRTMDAFRVFDTVFAMTGGGPGTATEVITIYNYRVALRLLCIGQGAAIGVWTLIFLLGPIGIYLYLLYEKG